ncbi:hypothetical protein QBC35DRAFT_495530 [Podospora australis]|uniref:General stress protein FMN-binding split barrel domain-containing protein n=1 Tax=Podospora australis TaxID=1536484 RepID=A0AAN7AKF2_9PEZI|nr:hypothetical protein QBC35DRAFT_495530 [Podospora australis]
MIRSAEVLCDSRSTLRYPPEPTSCSLYGCSPLPYPRSARDGKFPIGTIMTSSFRNAACKRWALTSWLGRSEIKGSSPSLNLRPNIIILNKKSFATTTQLLRDLKPNNQQQKANHSKMAQTFSNTDAKHADPYKEANLDNNVSLDQRILDLSEFMNNCKFSLMTTRDAKSGNLVSRCMALAGQELGGVDLLFHTNTESGKTDDLATDSHINIGFLNNSGEWASISGTANIVTDRSLVKKYYKSHLKAWLGDLGDGKHDGSENDPRIGIIRVKMTTAHYAISQKNMVSHLAEVAQGTITGKPASVNRLREISEAEVSQWRSTH